MPMNITAKHTALVAAAAALALFVLARIYALPPGVLVFSADGSGRGQGAILHPGTAHLVDAEVPARGGGVVEIYLAGPSRKLQECPAGAACEAAGVGVSIGGAEAEVLFAGRPAGASQRLQVNVRIPAGAGAGPRVPVRVRAWGKESNEVTLAIR